MRLKYVGFEIRKLFTFLYCTFGNIYWGHWPNSRDVTVPISRVSAVLPISWVLVLPISQVFYVRLALG